MSIFDNVTFMNEADSDKVTKADYLKKKQQRAEDLKRREDERKKKRDDNEIPIGNSYEMNPTFDKKINGSREDKKKAYNMARKDDIRADWAARKQADLGARGNSEVYQKLNKRFRDKPSEYKEYIKSKYAHSDSEFTKKFEKDALRLAGFKTEAGIFESVEII